jgi:AcrR family transcriptional regulator
MPPHADLQLQERILKVAQNLWKAKGEHGLTLRAVAKLAGTTTPTVYKRFRNREALLVALAARLRDQLNEELFTSKSLEDVVRRYLTWAEAHPHEYDLLFRAWADIFHPDMPRPGRAWFMMKLAERYGGDPEDYAQAFMAILSMAHGAASMITSSDDTVAKDEIRRHFLSSVDSLLQNMHVLVPAKKHVA